MNAVPRKIARGWTEDAEKGYTEGQILATLHQVEADQTIPEVCRKLEWARRRF